LRVVVVNGPLKATPLVASVRVTVLAVTAPEKVAVLVSVTVRVPVVFTEVPIILPVVPLSRLKLLFPAVTVPKVIPAPAVDPLAAVLIVDVPVNATVPNWIAPPSLCSVPLSVVVPPVAVNPASSVLVPVKSMLPVLAKVAALVTVLPAFKSTAKGWLAELKLLVVTAPSKAMVPVVLFNVMVLVFTVPSNVVPPELATVRVPMSVPTVPVTVTVPVVLTVKLDVAPPVVPATEATVIGVFAPAPADKVTPSANVVLPKVI